MEIKTLGICGYGHFGKFVEALVCRFLPEAEVRVYSRRNEPDGERFFSLENTGASDVVVLCGAIHEYKTQLVSVLPHLGAATVVVDVATVKKHTDELFKKHLNGRQWLSCHPMFGAESYTKTEGDVSGYRIVVTNHTLTEGEYKAVKNYLTNLGFSVVEMTPDEHDQLLADTLFMTHYIGQVMSNAGFVRTDIDTVSFGHLMHAVESVAQDKKLFMDVYTYNPYCEAAAVRFHDAQEEVLKGLLGKTEK